MRRGDGTKAKTSAERAANFEEHFTDVFAYKSQILALILMLLYASVHFSFALAPLVATIAIAN